MKTETKEEIKYELSIILVLVRGILKTGDEWSVIEPAIREVRELVKELLSRVEELENNEVDK